MTLLLGLSIVLKAAGPVVAVGLYAAALCSAALLLRESS